MKNTIKDVMEYVKEEDVKFVRLAFCDLKGNLRNCAINADELESAFINGVSFDGSAIDGFLSPEKSDLILFPDPTTLTLLPWRPSRGKVVRLFCDIKYIDGTPFEKDSRTELIKAIKYAKDNGITCDFGAEFEFYLFKLDENGEKTNIPADFGGYMDVAPLDKCENVRREICLTIEEMGLLVERSHHEEGPGQNEIDFKYSDALTSADQSIIFKNATETIADKNGLWATFEPKPIKDASGSGVHINVSVKEKDGKDIFESFVAGVLDKARDITAICNPTESSYSRLGKLKAPKEIFAGESNRNALIRIPATKENKRLELRSPDGNANIYLAYALIIYAGVEGVIKNMKADNLQKLELPTSLKEAKEIFYNSGFIKKYLSSEIIKSIK